LDAYKRDLESDNCCRIHVRHVVANIRRIAQACEFQSLHQINGLAIKAWLASERAASRQSMQTSTHYLGAMKALTRWLVRQGRLPADPLAGVKQRPRGEIPVTFKRRAFTTAEINRLLVNAYKGRPLKRLTGQDRMYLYLTASGTGFRAHELSTIMPANCS